MKIGLFIDGYHPRISGVITSVDSLKSGLEKLGHEVYIITGGKKYELNNRIMYLRSINFDCWNCMITNFLSKENLRHVLDLNLDIIHSHTEFTIGLLANQASKKLEIPNIHTYHTSYDDYKHYALNNIFGLGDYLENIAVDNYCRDGIDQLITPSNKTYEYLVNKFKIEKEKNIIKTGICSSNKPFSNLDKEKIKNELKYNQSDFIILCVGRIAKEKNLKILIDAQKKLNIYNNIKLLFIGDGPELNQLKRYVEKNNIKNINFYGKIPHGDIYKFYHMADITVVSSKTETQGLSIIESMQNGTPVICINDDTFDYVVDNGYNGLIFDSIDDYINKILFVFKNKDILDLYGKNALISSLEYNDVNYALEVEKVYKKCR